MGRNGNVLRTLKSPLQGGRYLAAEERGRQVGGQHSARTPVNPLRPGSSVAGPPPPLRGRGSKKEVPPFGGKVPGGRGTRPGGRGAARPGPQQPPPTRLLRRRATSPTSWERFQERSPPARGGRYRWPRNEARGRGLHVPDPSNPLRPGSSVAGPPPPLRGRGSKKKVPPSGGKVPGSRGTRQPGRGAAQRPATAAAKRCLRPLATPGRSPGRRRCTWWRAPGRRHGGSSPSPPSRPGGPPTSPWDGRAQWRHRWR